MLRHLLDFLEYSVSIALPGEPKSLAILSVQEPLVRFSAASWLVVKESWPLSVWRRYLVVVPGIASEMLPDLNRWSAALLAT